MGIPFPQDKRDFSRKSQIFPTPVCNTPAEGFLLGNEYQLALGIKKYRMMGLPCRPQKKFDDIFSRLMTIHERHT